MCPLGEGMWGDWELKKKKKNHNKNHLPKKIPGGIVVGSWKQQHHLFTSTSLQPFLLSELCITTLRAPNQNDPQNELQIQPLSLFFPVLCIRDANFVQSE